MQTKPLKFQISPTVSRAAAEEMEAFFAKDPALFKGELPKTQADWDRVSAQADAGKRPQSDAFAKKCGVTVDKDLLGGVPVLRIKPPGGATETSKALLYTHGGGYLVFSASAELVLPTLMATELGVEVISIDYTLAPRANYDVITSQIVSVYKQVVENGIPPQVLQCLATRRAGA